MITVFDVANYFLFLVDPDTEDCVTNLKLQKLCYYAQGLWLAQRNIRMFDNDLEAWLHGPVVRDLYVELKQNGNNPVPYPIGEKCISLKKFSEEERQILDNVHLDYGQYSAWMLRNMTHEETPWVKANNGKCKIISDNDMKEYFSQN